MCVALPARVTAIDTDGRGLRPGVCDFDGRPQQVDLGLLPEVAVGDFVIVHSGYAIRVVPAEDASSALQLIDDT